MIGVSEARRTRGRRAERWGVVAEKSAADWYRARGGRVVAERVRTDAGEIDLVVDEGDALVFVEVKARKRLECALASVSPARWARIGNSAEIYADRVGARMRDMRIDLFAVGGDGRTEVVPNAPLAGAL